MADNKPGAQTKAAEETREIESDRLRWLVEAQGAAYVQGMEVMADKLATVLAERLADQPRVLREEIVVVADRMAGAQEHTMARLARGLERLSQQPTALDGSRPVGGRVAGDDAVGDRERTRVPDAATHPLVGVVHAQLRPAHDQLAGGRIAGRRQRRQHAQLGRRAAGRLGGRGR